jgi:predicted transcriptional regulator
MPNLSVKLDEATRDRLQRIAAREGVTPHALMVRAIGHELDRTESQEGFMARALASLRKVEIDGKVFDGAAYADYVRTRARGESAKRPPAQKLTKLIGSDK